MMMMYFHGGYNEVILFDSWRIDSVGGLVGSMIACFVMGVLYEGLKFARDHVLRTSGTFKAGFIFVHLARNPHFDNVTRRPRYSRGPSGFLP